jgi:POT family proton-dependent oligopeptide transporter
MGTHEKDSEKGRPTEVTSEALDSGSDSDGLPRDATEDEIRTLPRVVDKIPVAAWAAALVGSAERFSYYCIISIWREFYYPLIIHVGDLVLALLKLRVLQPAR